MKVATRQERKISDISPLAIGSRFDRFSKEEEKSVRKNEVREDLDPIQKRFREILKVTDCEYEMNYNRYLYYLRDLDYSPQDVERFCMNLDSLGLEDIKDKWSRRGQSVSIGLFLSALINKSEEKDFTLCLYGIRTRIPVLGYRNKKNITILGDAGIQLGMRMQGGRITVKGNAGGSVGIWMEGGEIHIEGEFVDKNDVSYGAPHVTHGKVYVKGKLVVDK